MLIYQWHWFYFTLRTLQRQFAHYSFVKKIPEIIIQLPNGKFYPEIKPGRTLGTYICLLNFRVTAYPFALARVQEILLFWAFCVLGCILVIRAYGELEIIFFSDTPTRMVLKRKRENL